MPPNIPRRYLSAYLHQHETARYPFRLLVGNLDPVCHLVVPVPFHIGGEFGTRRVHVLCHNSSSTHLQGSSTNFQLCSRGDGGMFFHG
jgi:hypothetical protein